MREWDHFTMVGPKFIEVHLRRPGTYALITVICKACGRVYQVEEGGLIPDDAEHPHGPEEVVVSKAMTEAYEEEMRRGAFRYQVEYHDAALKGPSS